MGDAGLGWFEFIERCEVVGWVGLTGWVNAGTGEAGFGLGRVWVERTWRAALDPDGVWALRGSGSAGRGLGRDWMEGGSRSERGLGTAGIGQCGTWLGRVWVERTWRAALDPDGVWALWGSGGAGLGWDGIG